MLKQFGISDKILELADKTENELMQRFLDIDRMAQHNQLKVLKAMQECSLADIHFQWNTGYGYNDIGRDKIEEIYSKIFNTEDSIVRPQIVSGTHALTLMLTGILRPGDTMLSITGKPYDTLEEVIGINGPNGSSLKEFGIEYAQVDLNDDGRFNLSEISKSIEKVKPKIAYIQRSGGYSFRRALTIDEIKEAIEVIKSFSSDIIIAVDNCYGEFLDYHEPTDVGADIIAGSLIKNPGGGLALTGGYITGKSNLVELVSYRLTSPGIGKETGLTFGQNRTVLQGLFIAPHTVSGALKGAIFCAKIFENLGYEVSPKSNDQRSDIIQAIKLGSENAVVGFCQGVQNAAPVDSFVSLVPWDMPGYDSKVIMAAGAFVQGSSIELSADAPIKPPYVAYFQGGLTYTHSKLGVLMGLSKIL